MPTSAGETLPGSCSLRKILFAKKDIMSYLPLPNPTHP